MINRGPKVKTDKIIKVTDRGLRTWRKNVAHLLLFGKSKAEAIKSRARDKTDKEASTTVRISRDRKAVLIKLAAKKGVSVRTLVDEAIDSLLY